MVTATLISKVFDFVFNKFGKFDIRSFASYVYKSSRDIYIKFKSWFVCKYTEAYSDYVLKSMPILHEIESLDIIPTQHISPEDCLDLDFSVNEWVNEDVADVDGKIIKEKVRKQRKKVASMHYSKFLAAMERKFRARHMGVDANVANRNAIAHDIKIWCESVHLNDADTTTAIMYVVPRVMIPDQSIIAHESLVYNTTATERRMHIAALRKSEDNPFMGLFRRNSA